MAANRGQKNRPRKSSHKNADNKQGHYSYYNDSSVAHDLEVEEEIYYRPRRRKRGTKKPRLKYVRAKNTQKGLALSTYLTIIILFACAFLCVISVSNVGHQQRVNLGLVSELKGLQDKTNELILQVNETMDLEQIEYIARTKLRMSEPGLHQIVYISVPKQNFTVYYPASTYDDYVASGEDMWLSLLSIQKLLFKD